MKYYYYYYRVGPCKHIPLVEINECHHGIAVQFLFIYFYFFFFFLIFNFLLFLFNYYGSPFPYGIKKKGNWCFFFFLQFWLFIVILSIYLTIHFVSCISEKKIKLRYKLKNQTFWLTVLIFFLQLRVYLAILRKKSNWGFFCSYGFPYLFLCL